MRERLGRKQTCGPVTVVGMRTAGEYDRHSDGVTVVACLGQINPAFMNKCLCSGRISCKALITQVVQRLCHRLQVNSRSLLSSAPGVFRALINIPHRQEE